METWKLVVFGVVCIIAGVLIGIWLVGKEQKGNDKLCQGLLIIDKEDPVANGGVYSQFFTDPQSFMDGEIIKLRVEEVHIKTKKDDAYAENKTGT